MQDVELAGTAIAVARAGDDVVVAATDTDLFVEIARSGALTGGVVWQHRSGEAETTAGAARVEVGPRLVLLTGATSAVLDTATGTVVFAEPPLSHVLTTAVGDRFVTWSTAHAGMLHDATGAPELAVPGFPAEHRANDGLAQLETFGLRDGVPYWSLALPADMQSMSAQGGHLLVHTADGLVALG